MSHVVSDAPPEIGDAELMRRVADETKQAGLADARARAGAKARAALAHDDLAAGHALTRENLHAEALRL